MFGSIYMMFTALSGLTNPDAVSQSMLKNMDQWESLFDQITKSDPRGDHVGYLKRKYIKKLAR
jgi:hypothetical protein